MTSPAAADLEGAARALWDPAGVYLNTASYGLPPRPAWDALQAALADWRTGATSWEGWGEATHRARALFGRLVGVPPERVAQGPTVSGLVAPLAAAIPDDTRVLAPEMEFTSLLFPFLAQAGRGRRVRVDLVPLPRLAEAIGPGTGVVAFSAVQSATGEVADVEAILAAAAGAGALTVVDATQACGWLPLDASRVDALVCSAYKWLMCPRGTAFMTFREGLAEALPPLAAGWFAGEDPHATYYGAPLRLAADARRLDVSPAWFSWVGTEPALATLLELGVERVRAHDLALANAFRAGLGLPPGDSAIVIVDAPDADRRLAGTEVRASVREGRLRTSWHAYNTRADVDRVLDLLGVG